MTGISILTYWQCLVLCHEGEHQRISGIDGRAAKRMPGQLAIVVLPKVQATECEDIDSCHPFWRCRESRAIPRTGVVDDRLTGLQERLDERGDFGVLRDIPQDPCEPRVVKVASSVVGIAGQRPDTATRNIARAIPLSV